MTSRNLWNCYRHKIDDVDISASFKTKLVRETPEPRNPWDADQPAQPPVPFLNAKETIF